MPKAKEPEPAIEQPPLSDEELLSADVKTLSPEQAAQLAQLLQVMAQPDFFSAYLQQQNRRQGRTNAV